MIDMNANITPMTVQMPADLIAEIKRIATKMGTTVDELVQEACAQLVEPYTWEACASEWYRPDANHRETDAVDATNQPGSQP
jgi:hypothetical protein